MDHAGMDHGGMDHGGMDMGNKCNMNVGVPFLKKTPPLILMHTSDALHLGHYESMHHLPLVAHHLDFHPPYLSRRGSNTHSWL